MSTRAFNSFLTSIQGHIGNLNNRVTILETQATVVKLEGSGSNTEQVACEPMKTQGQLSETQTAIKELREFFVKMKRQWKKLKDRSLDMSSGHLSSVSLQLLMVIQRMFVSSSLTRSSHRTSGGTC